MSTVSLASDADIGDSETVAFISPFQNQRIFVIQRTFVKIQIVIVKYS